MEEYIKILRNSRLFTGLMDKEILGMVGCMSARVTRHEKGNIIIRKGDMLSWFGLVLSGDIHLIMEDFWGNRAILQMMQPSDIFGAMYACVKTERIDYDAVCVNDVILLEMDGHRAFNVCRTPCSSHNTYIRNLLEVLAEENLRLTHKVAHISQRTTKDKLLSYLSEQAEKAHNNCFEIPLNRQQLADYLSVDRSAMSNELSKLRSAGIIEFNKNKFVLNKDCDTKL